MVAWSASLLVATFACPGPPATPDPLRKAIGVEEAVARLDPAQRPPNRFALVVGVGQYADRRIPALPACERDARELASVLADPAMGLFPPQNVTLLVDGEVTRTAVVAALDRLARDAGPDDLVVVYFSGHGATDEKGRAYWVMGDTRVDALRATALPEVEITELLGEIASRRLVTIIDACYSAATASVGSTKSLIDLGRIYPEFRGDGRVGLTASKGDQLSVVITDRGDPGFGHSAFTYHVIEGLRGHADARGNGDGVIELDELWSFVKDRTIETARRQGGNQEPQLKGQFGSRFLLAVDGPRLSALAEARSGADQRAEAQIAALRELFIAEQIDAARFEEARGLLRAALDALSEAQRERRAIYADLAEGRLAPRHLAGLLAEEPAPQPATASSSPRARDWRITAASIASRFSDVEAPLAVAVDLDALRADPMLTRFAERLGVAGRQPAGAGEPGASGPAMQRALLLGDPAAGAPGASAPAFAVLRRHRGELPAGDAAAGTAVASVDPSTTLVMSGDARQIERLLARDPAIRPAWLTLLGTVLGADRPIAVAADGPWALRRLEAFAEGRDGRLFVGRVYASLMLDDAEEFARLWAEATDGLLAVGATGDPSGPWLRTILRLEFATEADAERAAPRWRQFIGRLPEWAGQESVRPLDVQQQGATLLLRLDARTESVAAWIERHGVLQGAPPVTPPTTRPGESSTP